ncbi:hypothetical protein FPQ18DRAFT_343582 [Pyronema domesticum]|nr:hypothetical protein FPQ18DRAFT_343582 [Pyronema domesticum]
MPGPVAPLGLIGKTHCYVILLLCAVHTSSCATSVSLGSKAHPYPSFRYTHPKDTFNLCCWMPVLMRLVYMSLQGANMHTATYAPDTDLHMSTNMLVTFESRDVY